MSKSQTVIRNTHNQFQKNAREVSISSNAISSYRPRGVVWLLLLLLLLRLHRPRSLKLVKTFGISADFSLHSSLFSVHLQPRHPAAPSRLARSISMHASHTPDQPTNGNLLRDFSRGKTCANVPRAFVNRKDNWLTPLKERHIVPAAPFVSTVVTDTLPVSCFNSFQFLFRRRSSPAFVVLFFYCLFLIDIGWNDWNVRCKCGWILGLFIFRWYVYCW